MNKVTHIVHWPGKEVFTCDEHAKKLMALGSAMGFIISSTFLLSDTAEICKNCESEKKKKL